MDVAICSKDFPSIRPFFNHSRTAREGGIYMEIESLLDVVRRRRSTRGFVESEITDEQEETFPLLLL